MAHTRTQHCSKVVGGLARQGELAIHCLYTLALQKCQGVSGRTCPDSQRRGCVAGPVQRACLVVQIMGCFVPHIAPEGWHSVFKTPKLLRGTVAISCAEGVKQVRPRCCWQQAWLPPDRDSREPHCGQGGGPCGGGCEQWPHACPLQSLPMDTTPVGGRPAGNGEQLLAEHLEEQKGSKRTVGPPCPRPSQT